MTTKEGTDKQAPVSTNQSWWKEVETSNLSPTVKERLVSICEIIWPTSK
jgi:hypothetical protein